MVGKRFSCKSVGHLKKLGLLEKPSSISVSDLSQRVFVTAFSASHYGNGLALISSIQKFVPHATLVVYDLGLEEEQVLAVKALCNVQYRRFEFERYPPRVQLLSEYRWKPLVIAEALRDFPVIMYMDSSVQLTRSNLVNVFEDLTCKHRQDSEVECSRPYLLFSYTGHGVFAATHPLMYEYLPSSTKAVRSEMAPMFEAGIALVARTHAVTQDVLKWYVACALENDCMAPVQRPMLDCMFRTADRFSTYADCHRYDQSALNIILANANGYDIRRYTSARNSFFRIERRPPNVNASELQLHRCR